MWRAVLVFVLFLAAPAAWAAGLPTTKHTLTDKNAVFEISADYPQTGDAKIDADLQATIKRIAAAFKKEAIAAHDPSELPYTLYVDFTVARNDAQVFAVIFRDEWDFRGAHPNMELVTANYFRDGSWRVFLPEIFDGQAGLQRISKLAIADLMHRLLGPEPETDKDLIARGADAHWSNFAAFILLPDALEIHFPPYQVAAYSAGPQVARVPLAKLTDVMRANPRAPVASFDCARAATEDEHAICSDVTLARLDRQVSDSWTAEFRNENDPQRKARWKTEQLAWLKKRSASCGTGTGLTRVACLAAFYKARLAAIEDEE